MEMNDALRIEDRGNPFAGLPIAEKTGISKDEASIIIIDERSPLPQIGEEMGKLDKLKKFALDNKIVTGAYLLASGKILSRIIHNREENKKLEGEIAEENNKKEILKQKKEELKNVKELEHKLYLENTKPMDPMIPMFLIFGGMIAGMFLGFNVILPLLESLALTIDPGCAIAIGMGLGTLPGIASLHFRAEK
jgi:hypothetical protein